MKLVLVLVLVSVVGALVTGCAGRGPAPSGTPVIGTAAQGDWFCQMNASGDGWDCVQDPGRARRPDPVRVPEPPAPPKPGAEPLRGTPNLTEPERLLADAVPRPDPEPPAADAGSSGTAGDPEAPDYLRLAYVPPQPMNLTELPGDLYAVQLMAMSSKASLERFVDREGISGISAARVERDGELYYVLILGIYESAADAQRAVASLPETFAAMAPWIRPLRSLQAAMVRADAITGSTRY